MVSMNHHSSPVRTSWLDQPLSAWWCAIGWLAAVAVFMGLVRLLGGPAQVDAAESIYSTWAIAHGSLACAYPPGITHNFPGIGHPIPFIAPLWPLLSGGISALVGIGHNVPFPSQSALGPHCSTALAAIGKWSDRSGAAVPTMRLGYLSWLVLMAGVVALLRTSGRGRCRWEPVVLVVMACLPFVLMPLLDDFHPQDLVAMGLILGGVACTRRGWWVWAGMLLGLAVTSQQFALLVVAPLFVVAPSDRRMRFIGAAVGTAALIVVPLMAVTSGRAFNAVVLGSGNTSSVGGTVLWEMQLHGALLVALSRILPIILSMALAWWLVRRLGTDVLEPVPLVSLMATSLGLRLVFEQNLFGYYFMALAVSLILLDVVGGRIRGELVAWVALVTLAFDPAPWKLQFREYLPALLMAVALVLILLDASRLRIRWYLVAWLVLVAAAFARFPLLPLRPALPTWFWQVVLVGTGVVLAVRPLISSVRDRLSSEPPLTEGPLLSEAHSLVV
jgi:hypothetical protein